jgi:purine-binding chemotaxis protein CheW
VAPSALFLTLYVGADAIYVAAGDVSEVARRPLITRVPGAAAMIEGLANVRGKAVPVVSVARWLDLALPKDPQKFVLLSGTPALGLMVDAIGDLVELPLPGQAPPPLLLRRDDDGRLHPLELGRLLADLEAHEAGHARPTSSPQSSLPKTSPADKASFVTFQLSRRTYALQLSEVLEVMRLPRETLIAPGADPSVVGVVEWRGRPLPIMDLRLLLDLAPLDPLRNVIVAELGGRPVGLGIEAVGSILRLEQVRIDPVPAAINQGDGETQVVSIARPPRGGLVAVLSTARLFSVARAAAISEQPLAERAQHTLNEPRSPHLLFQLADETYGLALDGVEAIAEVPATMTRLPSAPAFIVGVADRRGEAMPVIDQGARLDLPAAAKGKVIVTRVRGAGLAAFRVDAILGIQSLGASQITPSPRLGAASASFRNVAAVGDDRHLILLAHAEDLLATAERDILRSATTASL